VCTDPDGCSVLPWREVPERFWRDTAVAAASPACATGRPGCLAAQSRLTRPGPPAVRTFVPTTGARSPANLRYR